MTISFLSRFLLVVVVPGSVALSLRQLQVTEEDSRCVLGASNEVVSGNGTCQLYPADGVCATYLSGKYVYIVVERNGHDTKSVGVAYYQYDEVSFNILEGLVQRTFDDVVLLRSIASEDCFQVAARFTCERTFLQCSEVDGQAIPHLPCIGQCADYWSNCSSAEVLNWDFVLRGDPSSAQVTMCGAPNSFVVTASVPFVGNPSLPAGSFVDITDIFGGRKIPRQVVYPVGYEGQPRFASGLTPYVLPNASVINVSCTSEALKTYDDSNVNTNFSITGIDCRDPFIVIDGLCKLPCPYFLYSEEEYSAMYWSFVLPSIPGLFMCLFVFVDSLMVILRSFNQNGIFDRIKPSSESVSIVQPNHKRPTTGPFSGIKVITLYAFVGSAIALVYYAVGPLLVAFGSSNFDLGCPINEVGISVPTIANGYDESTACLVNRGSLFILQLLLNVVVFVMCRVRLTVFQSIEDPRSRRVGLLTGLLLCYCIGVPTICGAVAFVLDDPGLGTIRIHVTLSRWSLMCAPRLTITQEYILVFTPLIISSVIATVAAFDIFRSTENVRSMRRASKIGAATAVDTFDSKLRGFLVRLGVLGFLCTVFIVVYLMVTSFYLPEFDAIGEVINDYFVCAGSQSSFDALSGTSCAECIFPDSSTVASPVEASLQFASLSLIPGLFGVFFTMTALERIKWDRARTKASRSGSKGSADA